jgi:hypothetical protein
MGWVLWFARTLRLVTATDSMTDFLIELLKSIFGENVLQKRFRIHLGFLIMIVALSAYIAIWIYHLNWEWNSIKERVATMPEIVSNAVNAAVVDDIGVLDYKIDAIGESVNSVETNQFIMSGQIDDLKNVQSINAGKIERIEGYIEGNAARPIIQKPQIASSFTNSADKYLDP